MRFAELFELYKERLGNDRVTPRTWDRLIAVLRLADKDLTNPDRRRLVLGAALIRRTAPTCSLSREFVQAYLALRSIQDASEMTGAELLAHVRQVKPVQLRAVQRWFERSPNGVRISLTRRYSGEELRFVFEQVLLRLYSRPSKLSVLLISNPGELGSATTNQAN